MLAFSSLCLSVYPHTAVSVTVSTHIWLCEQRRCPVWDISVWIFSNMSSASRLNIHRSSPAVTSQVKQPPQFNFIALLFPLIGCVNTLQPCWASVSSSASQTAVYLYLQCLLLHRPASPQGSIHFHLLAVYPSWGELFLIQRTSLLLLLLLDWAGSSSLPLFTQNDFERKVEPQEELLSQCEWESEGEVVEPQRGRHLLPLMNSNFPSVDWARSGVSGGCLI